MLNKKNSSGLVAKEDVDLKYNLKLSGISFRITEELVVARCSFV